MSEELNLEITRWKNALMDLNFSHGRIDHDERDEKDYLIKQTEIALKHPETDSLVKLQDDGCIDIFAGPKLGVRVDPQTNSVNLFGDNVNIIANNFNIKTKPNGFKWNGYYLNPELYYEDDKQKEQKIAGTIKKWVHNPQLGWHWEEQSWNVRPMLKSKTRVQYSEGMLNILKDFGLPVEDVDKEDE